MSADYYADFAYYTNAQYIVLGVIGVMSCLLSLFGSCTIIYLVIYGRRTNELYHRLVLGLSLSDLFMTTTLMFQPLLTPRETGYAVAVGNEVTCHFVGFGYLFFITSYTYNCMLGIYFLAVVRYRTTSKTISRYLEPWGHILAFIMPIAIGSASLWYNMLNVNPFLNACMLFPSDHECTWKDGVECENASAYEALNSTLDFYALGMVGIGLICTVAVWLSVRKQFRADDKDAFGTRFANEEDRRAQLHRIRSISRQAIWYAVAFMVGLLCVVIANVVGPGYLEDSLSDLGDSTFYFVISIFLWMFFPLQGFFNCLVYIRPRWVRWKAYYKNESWWFAFVQVLSLETAPQWGESAQLDNNTSIRSLNKRLSKAGSKSGASDSKPRNGTGKGILKRDDVDSDALYWANDTKVTRLEGLDEQSKFQDTRGMNSILPGESQLGRLDEEVAFNEVAANNTVSSDFLINDGRMVESSGNSEDASGMDRQQITSSSASDDHT